MKLEQPARQLIEQLLGTLQTLPQMQANLVWASAASSVDREHDAQITLRISGRSCTLLIGAKKAVYPRDVREFMWQFRGLSRDTLEDSGGNETLPLLAAASISQGAKDLLRAERVGYYDSGGSLFLPAQGVYLDIERPAPKTSLRSARALFSGRRAQVLHTLLVRHRDWFGVKGLAAQAEVSAATASEVLTELERLDWVSSRGRGPSKERYLNEPAALLDAWVKQLASTRPPVLQRYYVPAVKADQLLKHVSQVFASLQLEYAVSHEAAAQRYAPFLTSISQVRCRLLPGPSADAAIGELGARVVSEGANFAIIEVKSAGELLLRECIDGIWCASPIQVYLDLLRGEGRAKEMAQHLRKERIGF
jgi:hypothetical protein